MCNKNADSTILDCFFWCGQSIFADGGDGRRAAPRECLDMLACIQNAPVPAGTIEGRVMLPLSGAGGQECAARNAIAGRWNS